MSIFFAGVPAPSNAIAYLTGVSGKEKIQSSLRALRLVKYVPFDLHRFEAKLR
jgi:hypothetical protein